MNGFRIAGMTFGGLLILLGLIMFGLANNADYVGEYFSNASFGGDYYSYQYEATAKVGENVAGVGELIESVSCAAFNVGGFFSILLGGVVICYFGCKTNKKGANYAYEENNINNNIAPAPVQYVQNNVTQYPNQNNNTMEEKKAKLDGLLAKGLITREDYDNAMKN